jgi:putative DNA primase/helicase
MMNARAITKALSGRWCGSYGIARCPAHDDREPSLKIRDDARKRDGIDLVCFAGCDWRDIKAELKDLLETEPRRWPRTAEAPASACARGRSGTILPPKIDDDAKQRTEYALRLWPQSVPLSGTLGWRYFTERRELHIGVLGDLSHALRWHAGIGAVVALMTDPLTNKRCGIHRTFLNSDGTKRDRKMLGRQGVVRLSPDEEVTTGLGIVEGVEDGLAVLLSGWTPVWAATSAGAIERFPVLPGIESLTVFADADAAGMKAAQVCVERWATARG